VMTVVVEFVWLIIIGGWTWPWPWDVVGGSIVQEAASL
jgi:hypothetical protein